MVSRDKPIVHFKEGLVNDNIEMNNDSRLDNKRIAKNSVMLYLRMFLMVGISIYTSRVILKVLGVTDYGIYNVVGSVVITFNFVDEKFAEYREFSIEWLSKVLKE